MRSLCMPMGLCLKYSMILLLTQPPAGQEKRHPSWNLEYESFTCHHSGVCIHYPGTVKAAKSSKGPATDRAHT